MSITNMTFLKYNSYKKIFGLFHWLINKIDIIEKKKCFRIENFTENN